MMMTMLLIMIKHSQTLHRIQLHSGKYLFSILLFYFQFLHAYAMSDKIKFTYE